MKYLLLEEISEWNCDQKNHTYITTENKEKVVGYLIRGTATPVMFDKPMRFETRYRKFKTRAFESASHC